MPRTTKSLTAKANTRVLDATKGHYVEVDFRTAKQSNIKFLQYAFETGRIKKDLSSSLDSRINAGARELEFHILF